MVGLFPVNEPAALVQDFQEQTGVTFPLLEDRGLTMEIFAYPEGTRYPFPRDVVIGPDLRVESIKNSFDANEMTALIDRLLEGAP